MKLQDRNLSIGMQGDDVKLLHNELIQLGFEIPAEELESLIDVDPQPARFGSGTRQAVRRFQDAHGLEPNGTVDERTAVAINAAVETEGSFLVQGKVRHADGTLIPELTVRAYDRGIGRKVLLLGQDVTNAEGHYEINYKAEVLARYKKSRADLFVKILSADKVELLESEIRFGAQPIETVDFVIAGENYRGHSEYQQLIAKLTPLLQDMQLGDLQENDIEYLAGKTGTELQQITHLVASEKLAQQTSIPAEVFYGGLRQNLPTTLPALLDQNPDVINRALDRAVDGNIISVSMREQVDEFVGRLPSMKADVVLEPTAEGPASLGDLLSTVLSTTDKQRAVAEVFVNYPGMTEEFWKAVRERPELTEQEINQVQTTLHLGTLTGNHLPLVRELQKLAHEDPELNELRGFAKLELEDWVGILRNPQENGEPISLPLDVPGEDESAKITNYAAVLNDFIENTFPTNVIAQRLDKDDRADSPFRPIKADLKIFFTNNPTFEFGATPIGIYLGNDREQKLAGVHPDKQEELTGTLKSMQRLYKITPRIEQISNLLADNLHSSQGIVSMGQRTFMKKHQETFGSEALALTAYKQAEHVHLRALMLYAKHSVMFNSPAPYAITGGATGALQQMPVQTSVGGQQLIMLTSPSSASEPEWSTLFGSLDLCDCEHCKSVYSPSAYLVDILKFLKDGATKNDATPLQVLLERRPDLEHIELTCENTDTPLPYVDLVREVLENAIAPLAPQMIPITISSRRKRNPVADLDSKKVPMEFKNAITGITPPLAQQATVKVDVLGEKWRIVDGARRWIIEHVLAELEIIGVNQKQHHIEIGTGSNAVTELDKAHLPPEVRLALPTYLFLTLGNSTVSILQPGMEWQIAYDIEATVHIEVQGPANSSLVRFLLGTAVLATFTIPRVQAAGMVSDLNGDVLSTWLAEKLGIPIDNAIITVIQPNQEWRITRNQQATVKFVPAKLIVTSLALQTSATLDELNANPEHTNTKAYDQLRQAVYPWSLPLNLWTDEARVYLNHLGLQRHEVMETFFKGPPFDALNNKDIAFEYLELTPEEAKLINGTTTGGPSATTPYPGPWNFWGLLQVGNDNPDPLDGSGWDVVLRRISVFLQQSGLSYKELLELLSTYFINPIKMDGTRALSLVAIEKDDEGKDIDPATCDLSKLRINSLDEIILNKIHRFVRLWRKIGWTIRDLDQAITALKPLDLDDNFLRQLSHIQRLRATLNVPLVNMLSWWADIDTASYIDHMVEGQSEVKSLYERLFRNKTIVDPVDEAFTQDPKALIGKISQHMPAIAAALRISNADLSLLLGLTRQSIPMHTISASVNGSAVDRAHYPAPMFVLDIRTVAEADNQFTIKFQESDDDSTYNDVPNVDLLGGRQPEVIDQNNDDRVIRRGYKGKKKFLRVAVTAVQGVTPSLAMSAQVVVGYDKVTDELKLANLSLLYRISSLAKALKLSIGDWLTVKALTEIDPFTETMATLQFVEKVRLIRASGFSINELNYLLRDVYIESSSITPSRQSIAVILAESREGLQKIAAEYTFVPDPTGELTRKILTTTKPALQWEDADVEQAISLLSGNAVYAELLASTNPLIIPLPSAATGKIFYDATAHELGWVGLMSEGEKTLLLSFAEDEEYLQAVDQIFNDAASGQTKTVPLDTLPQLAIPEAGPSKIMYDSQAAILRFSGAMTLLEQALLLDLGADQTAIDALFQQPRSFITNKMISFLDPADVIASLLDQESSREDKFDFVLTRLLDYRRKALGKILVKQNLGEALKLEASLIDLLLETVLKSRTDANRPAMSDFLALGLSATYFDNPDLTGATVKRTDPTINFDWNSGSPAPAIAVGTFSAQWIGKIQPQHSETYTFFTNTDDGVRLWVDNQLIIDKWQDQPVTEHSATLALKAGQLYDIKMEYYQNGFHAVADLRWSSPSTPKAIISANRLFPNDAPVLTYRLLHKIARLVSGFKISAEELAYVSTHSTDQLWLDITTLPLVETPSSALLFSAWERLVHLFRLRDTVPLGELGLFNLFDLVFSAALSNLNAVRSAAKQRYLENISQHTLWPIDELEILLGSRTEHRDRGSLGFVFPDDYTDERKLFQLCECFKLMKQLGASARQLSDWGNANQTATEVLDNARSIKNAVKAKCDDKQWLVVAKPLKDLLREKQRAALVAYLITHPDVAKGQYWRDATDLYEYFLIDVEMDPCMMTTRIKQAISSVQLFIQRCLMNLENDVSINSEDAKEWREWRKQYRVWEANRKVFLYPENWIEPELRDDKSPLFKDLENELLQNDMTMDTAETALLHYLEKLDRVARLEPAGFYSESDVGGTQSPAVERLHFFGRTVNTPHLYYYRTFEHGRWTGWEQVDLDIEGDHLIPVVWNGRLYLFWAILVEKTDTATEQQRKADQNPEPYWEVRIASSEYRRGKWTAKQVSHERIIHPSVHNHSPTETFSFLSTLVTEDQLLLRCYGLETVSQLPATKAAPKDESFSVGEYVLIRGSAYDTQNSNNGLPNVTVKVIKPETHGSMDSNGNYVVKTEDRVYQQKVTDSSGYYSMYFFEKIDGDVTILAEASNENQQITMSKKLTVASKNGYDVHFPFEGKKTVQPVPVTIDTKMISVGYFYVTADQEIRAVAAKGSEIIIGIRGAHREGMLDVENQGRNEEPLYLAFYTSDGKDVPVFNKTPYPFRILGPHQSHMYAGCWFVRDETHVYFLTNNTTSGRLAVNTFFHPCVGKWIKYLNRSGISGLLSLENQRLGDVVEVTLSGTSNQQVKVERELWERYSPAIQLLVDPTLLPQDLVEFEVGGAYSLYNWELFFHAPFLIATQLSKNQRFEDAQKWFHYIFDPTSSTLGGSERFWKVKPFYEEVINGIQSLEELINEGEDLNAQLEEWKENPFKPHAVARWRVVAYMKAVLMKYIDNLIAWGDQLFRRESLESINEATQLYILAAQILGKRPEEIPPRTEPEIQTFSSVAGNLIKDFGPMVNIEDYVFPSGSPNTAPTSGTSSLDQMWLFCIPKNDKLLGYWSTVADRLFKIRHCMNIEGVIRQLPIFEPPIDPGLLVRAVAAGVDISSALNDINAALPPYRFNIMLQKATELCNDVKTLGMALLSALEKRDAEALALLRSVHETKLLDAVRAIREYQIKEAKEALEGLKKSKDMAHLRFDYYANIEFMNDWEKGHLTLMALSSVIQVVAQLSEISAASAGSFPDFYAGGAGVTGSPLTFARIAGGTKASEALQSFARAMNFLSALTATAGSMSSTLGSYHRRADEWSLQERLAGKELEQIEKQIVAAEIRCAIAEHELRNHDLQVKNAKEMEAFMLDKYTSQELYDWMIGQISGIYFQSYQMAYDIAKRAERTFRHELGLADSNFIQFGYWDSLKKGLLAGERLHYDLKRMDVAYLDQNKREYEITKHISLLQLNPLALISLKETGQCEVELPEALFDADYPGHYMRRLKSMSLTIPAVVGPYTSVNCTLTLLSSKTRVSSKVDDADMYAAQQEGQVISQYGAIQSIATSHAQNDSGLFELNFRDERYLPFEGMGAILRCRIELAKDTNAIDSNTLSDIVLHLKYTAREGGEILKKWAKKAMLDAIEENAPLVRLFSAKHEFPTEWHRFLTPTNGDHAQSFALSKDRFPYLFQAKDRTITITQVELVGVPKVDQSVSVLPKLTAPGEVEVDLNHGISVEKFLHKVATKVIVKQDPNQAATLEPLLVKVEAKKESAAWIFNLLKEDDLPNDEDLTFVDTVEDILIVVTYTVTQKTA